jgi:uncharacterized membrane protein
MSRGGRLLVALAILWAVALVAAPAAIDSSHPTVTRMGMLVYMAGGIVCHQRPERSFAIAGHALPVCARCTGLYVSAVIGGLLALVLAPRRIDRDQARWLLALAALPTAVTWLAEMAGLAHPSNVVRAVAALSLGAVAAWLVVATMANDRV